MKTAIVILNWNGQKLLEQFLPSVISFSSNEADIYVADNASTDNSIKYIRKYFGEEVYNEYKGKDNETN